MTGVYLPRDGAAIIMRSVRQCRSDAPVPQPAANRVRIIGGAWRGRVIRFPAGRGLRPTPDRVRETLFNWLGQDLTGKRCLDLYAGSGALSLEAASRGAALAVAVDREPGADRRAARDRGARSARRALETHVARRARVPRARNGGSST